MSSTHICKGTVRAPVEVTAARWTTATRALNFSTQSLLAIYMSGGCREYNSYWHLVIPEAYLNKSQLQVIQVIQLHSMRKNINFLYWKIEYYFIFFPPREEETFKSVVTKAAELLPLKTAGWKDENINWSELVHGRPCNLYIGINCVLLHII